MSAPSSPANDETVYLDHAAATPLDAEVAEAMREAAGRYGNPSSPHAAGRAARRILEDARERLIAVLGGRAAAPDRDRLVFTSGATEANRLGILGLAGGWRGDGHAPDAGWIGTSPRDHSSVRLAAGELASRGWRLFDAPLSAAGGIAADAVRQAAAGRRGAGVLAVTTVCGQTGIREDLTAVAALSRAAGGLLVHADATQAAGWDEVDFAATPLATLALAPHKFGGPRGIGGLLVRAGVDILPTMPGPQELGLRGGTQPVHLAAGFARAAELAAADRRGASARVAALRDELERSVLAVAAAAGIEAVAVGGGFPRAPHVSLVALAGLDRQAVAMAADLAGVCLATGTACASGSSETPAVLAAVGLPERFRGGALRLSLGRTTTTADVGVAVSRLAAVFGRLRRGGGESLSIR